MVPLDEEDEDTWRDPAAVSAVAAVVPHYMSARSLALYARWWQLETWLRDLAYIELRSLAGLGWTDKLMAASGRQTADAAHTHMAGADNENPLAYLDYSQIVQVMGDHWDQFRLGLLERGSWEGRQEDLKRIRHRIGHLRQPHRDDLSRLEQTLRDLERGAFITLASYNRRHTPDPQHHDDPVTRGWIKGSHETARRLLNHADRQYDTRLLLQTSRRPWAKRPASLAAAPGILWHATFRMQDRTVDARELWNDTAMRNVRPLLVHLEVDDPWHVGFTFAAVDDPHAISDAVGAAFDAVLMVSRRGALGDDHIERWRSRAAGVDFRVKSNTGWNIVDETTVPITNFGAGGGLEAAPEW